MDLLETKVRLAGTEEAVTKVAEARQRMIAATDSMAATGGSFGGGFADSLVAEGSVGPLQEIRQYTARHKQDLAQIVQSFKDVTRELEPVIRPTRQRGGLNLGRAFDKIGKKIGLARGLDAAVEGIGHMVKGIASEVMPKAMGVGGILGWMLGGVAVEQELEAARHQFEQIFEQSTRTAKTVTEEVDRSAAKALAIDAEHLVVAHKATRQEIEAVGGAYAQAGISAGEIYRSLKHAIGEEQKNLFGLTLSLERHFELAGGTVARQAVGLMEDYGMSTEETADTLGKLYAAASQSGMGIENFTRGIQQAAEGVRFLGIRVDDVAALTVKLQDVYKGMGMSDHFAGEMAMKGVQGIMGGLAGMDVGAAAHLAQKIGLAGSADLEGAYRLYGQLQQKGGPDPEMEEKLIKGLHDEAMQKSHGNAELARWYLEHGPYRMSFEGAKAVLDIGDQLSKGIHLDKVSEGMRKQWRDSLKTEQQKTDAFQMFMERISYDMSKIGLAMFTMLTGFLAEIVLHIRLLLAVVSRDDQTKLAIQKQIKETDKVFPAMYKEISSNVGDMSDAARQLLGGSALSSLKLVSDAWTAGDVPMLPASSGRKTSIERIPQASSMGAVGSSIEAAVGAPGAAAARPAPAAADLGFALEGRGTATPAGASPSGGAAAPATPATPAVDYGFVLGERQTTVPIHGVETRFHNQRASGKRRH